MTTKYYHCKGSVRGDCGHHHRTLISADKCLKRDRKGCKKQGGYSDRYVIYEPSGEIVSREEQYQ